MPHVISHKCITEVYAACQAVCPADVMHTVASVPAGYPGQGQPMMVIHQDDCIDCGACVQECPVLAIVEDEDINPAATAWNRQLAPLHRGNRPPEVRPRRDPPRRTP